MWKALLEPFRHKEKEIRDIFAQHPNEDELLQEKHASMLSNFDQLKQLGLQLLLEWQTNELPPRRWDNVRIQVDGSTNWVRLFLRDDNVYVRGFANQHNSHGLTEPVNKEAPAYPPFSSPHAQSKQTEAPAPPCLIVSQTKTLPLPSPYPAMAATTVILPRATSTTI